jgi:hypothetical protein
MQNFWEVLREKQEGTGLEIKFVERKMESKIC